MQASNIPGNEGSPPLAILNASWRAEWVASNVEHMGSLEHPSKDGWDGINLDIEDFAGNETFRQALTSLVCELRASMSVALPGSQLSFCSAALPMSNSKHYDYARMAQCVDIFIPMAYAMTGKGRGGEPLQPNSPLPTVQTGLAQYQRLGIDATKLVLALPFYGYNVPCTERTPGPCLIAPGSWDSTKFQAGYGEIMGTLLPLAGGVRALRWNGTASSPYFDYVAAAGAAAVAPGGSDVRHRVVFDNPLSLQAKVAMARSMGVRSIGVWTVDAVPYASDPAAAEEMWAAIRG
jgi:di-N-acetylchitobiase